MGKYKVGIIGAGLVGEEMVRCLRQSKIFRNSELKILARSSRKQILAGEIFQVKKTKPEEFEGMDIAFFAGTEGEKGASVVFAKEAIKRGVIIIDKGDDFRMNPEVPLVVPEINPQDLEWHKGLIASPNCTTIIMLMALWPIHQVSKIKKTIVFTTQAVSGSGRSGKEELKNQILSAVSVNIFSGKTELSLGEQTSIPPLVYPQPIAFNLIPQIGGFDRDFTSEEWKTIRETHKILHDNTIAITPVVCARAPIFNVHSVAIYIETERKITTEEAKKILSKAPGVRVVDPYPTPQMANGIDEILVGRIREDLFFKKGLLLWVVGDNIRKGAALNALQIAEELVKRKLLKRRS